MGSVFVVLVEVTPLPGCTLVAEDRGAFVRSFVEARDEEDAVKRVCHWLWEQQVEIVEVTNCCSEAEMTWAAEDEDDAAEDSLEAQESGRVVVGRIDSYPLCEGE